MTKPEKATGQGITAAEEEFYASLRCPCCLGPFDLQTALLVCTGCGETFGFAEGVADLRVDGGGEVSGEVLPDLREQTVAAWQEAILEYLSGRSDVDEKLEALTASRRLVWKLLLDLSPESRVLLLGCGLGAGTQSLAGQVRKLQVLDESPGRLRFAQQRLRIFRPGVQVGLTAASLEGRLPFAGDDFDCVALTETVPEAKLEGLLEEVARILAPGGQVLLLAGNRVNLSLPSGWWDRWSAAVRPLPTVARAAGLVNGWWTRRSGARSITGTWNLIRSRGFTEIKTFGLWPGVFPTDEIIPLGSQQGDPPRSAGAPSKLTIRRRGGFLPGHYIVAQLGGTPRRSTLNHICSAAAQQLHKRGEVGELTLGRHYTTRKEKLIVLTSCAGQEVVLRVPLSGAAEVAERRNAAMLQHLSSSHLGLAPVPLAAGHFRGVAYRMESAIPGTPYRHHLREHKPSDPHGPVAHLLDTLNPDHLLQREKLVGPIYTDLVDARLKRLSQVIADSDREERLDHFFRSILYGADMPVGLVHGDFGSSNIFVTQDGMKLIDWEASAIRDLPILDAINYLESWLRPSGQNYSLAAGLVTLAACRFPSPREEKFLFERYERMLIDVRLHVGLVYLCWLRALDFLLPYWLRLHPADRKRYVDEVISEILQDR